MGGGKFEYTLCFYVGYVQENPKRNNLFSNNRTGNIAQFQTIFVDNSKLVKLNNEID